MASEMKRDKFHTTNYKKHIVQIPGGNRYHGNRYHQLKLSMALKMALGVYRDSHLTVPDQLSPDHFSVRETDVGEKCKFACKVIVDE